MNFFINLGYFGLFLACLGAATILPIGSEPIFTYLIFAKFNPFACLIIASIGNWLGGMINYYIGRLGKTEWIEKYLKINHTKITNIQHKLHNKSAFMAFFCFLPFIGDIIAIILGFARANIIIVNITMFIGKFLRYLLLLYSLEYITS
jgi:membrane protein YqaA with SNARE-associated domain